MPRQTLNLLLPLVLLAACDTQAGLGEDVSAVGDTIYGNEQRGGAIGAIAGAQPSDPEAMLRALGGPAKPKLPAYDDYEVLSDQKVAAKETPALSARICTVALAGLGLEYWPTKPDGVRAVIFAGDLAGKLGRECRANASQAADKVEIAALTYPDPAVDRYTVLVEVTAEVEGEGCRRTQPASFFVTMDIERSKYGVSYAKGDFAPDSRPFLRQCENGLCVTEADVDGVARDGVFASCEAAYLGQRFYPRVALVTVRVSRIVVGVPKE
jgi:predicted small secreted protein